MRLPPQMQTSRQHQPWPVSLTVSKCRDCTLGTDENFDYDTSLNAYYENYGADYFFSNVKSIFSADDLTIANFEGTLTDSEDREGQRVCLFKALLNMPAFLPPVLSKLSTLPTTTATIMEIRAMRDTISALDSAGILNFDMIRRL